MILPKLIILDRDGVLNFASSNPDSPLYYITKLEHLIMKPGVKEALQLVAAHGIPMVLATRQRGISKGLVSREMVNVINERLRRVLDVHFGWVYVEEEAEDKRAIFERIIREGVRPSDIVLFDDSPREIRVAQELGINAVDGSNLLEAVKGLLQIK